MSVLDFFRRRFSKNSNSKRETVSFETPDPLKVHGESDNWVLSNWLNGRDIFDMWTKVCADSSIDDELKQFDMPNVYCENVAKFYGRLFGKNLFTDMDEEFKLSYIKIATSKFFEKYAEVFVIPERSATDNPTFYNFEGFVEAFLNGLFIASIRDDLDFFAIFSAIKDIPIYRHKKSVGYEVIRYSFSDFTLLFSACNDSVFLSDKEKLIEKLNQLLDKYAEEFFRNASPKDIEALSAIPFKDADGRIASLICQKDFHFEQGMDTINAIIKKYPGLSTYLYEAHLRYVMDHVSQYPVDEISRVLYEMSLLKKYRSEEFESVNKSWKAIIDAALLTNGAQVYYVVELLAKEFSVNEKQARDYVTSTFKDFFIDDDGNFVILTANELVYLYNHLSNPDIYALIKKHKPSLLETLNN